MLLAVEGGGFFSSSASGYSKGLMLLLLGRKSEERPMRVSPWNQYQLVNPEPEPEPEPDLHLASRKDQSSHGCASFLCFRHSSAGLDGHSPELSTVCHPDALTVPCGFTDLGNDENRHDTCLRSSLKKPLGSPIVVGECGDNTGGIDGEIERRKVHWVDACGGDLVEIKEFEVSSYGASEDGFEDKHDRGCGCVIHYSVRGQLYMLPGKLERWFINDATGF